MTTPYYTPPDATATDTLYSRAAAGYVQDLAPVPDPEPDDYADLAEAAEFLVYNYLKGTDGASVTSYSRSGVSESFAKLSEISVLIGPIMGEYFVGPQATTANTGYIEDFA